MCIYSDMYDTGKLIYILLHLLYTLMVRRGYTEVFTQEIYMNRKL